MSDPIYCFIYCFHLLLLLLGLDGVVGLVGLESAAKLKGMLAKLKREI